MLSFARVSPLLSMLNLCCFDICMQVACLVLATYKILLPYIKNHEVSVVTYSKPGGH